MKEIIINYDARNPEKEIRKVKRLINSFAFDGACLSFLVTDKNFSKVKKLLAE